MHVVKIPFPYAHDGIHTEVLPEGAEREFRPELVEGLKEEGYIGDIGQASVVEPVVTVEPPAVDEPVVVDPPAPEVVVPEPAIPALEPPVVEEPPVTEVVEPAPEVVVAPALEKPAHAAKHKAK